MFLFKLLLVTWFQRFYVSSCILPDLLWQDPLHTKGIRDVIANYGPDDVFDGSWHSHMRNPTWDVTFSTFDANFKGAWFWYTADKWSFKNTSITIEKHSPRHNIEYYCERDNGDAKYILFKRDRGFTEYCCFHFIKRSDYVVQYKMSQSNREPDENLCDETNLVKSAWPLIRTGNWRFQQQTCPLSGGYDATWRHGSQPSLQPNHIARIESSCMATEGTHFTFQLGNIPNIGYNNSEILYCLGDWQEDGWTFMVMTLTKKRRRKPTGIWILRYPTLHGDQFTALLLGDVLATTSDPSTNNFIEFNMTRRLYHSACEDQSMQCEYLVSGSSDPECLRDNGWPSVHCPKSCGVCSANQDMSACNIDQKYLGEWLLYGLDCVDHISITNKSMNVEGMGNFVCNLLTGFTPGYNPVDYHANFIAILDNGCAPRYSCIELNQVAPDVIQYRISQSAEWPLSKAEDEPMCSQFLDHELHFRFDNDIDRYYSHKLKALVRVTSSRTSVKCQYPYNTTFTMEYTRGPNCTGTLWQRSCNSEEDLLILEKYGCTDQPDETQETQYRCLATFWSTDTYGWGSVGVLVTEKNEEPGQLNCWTLGRDTMFLAPAAECTMSHAIQYHFGIKIPIAKLTKQKEDNICLTEPIGPP